MNLHVHIHVSPLVKTNEVVWLQIWNVFIILKLRIILFNHIHGSAKPVLIVIGISTRKPKPQWAAPPLKRYETHHTQDHVCGKQDEIWRLSKNCSDPYPKFPLNCTKVSKLGPYVLKKTKTKNHPNLQAWLVVSTWYFF